jgi:hypothetical protein
MSVSAGTGWLPNLFAKFYNLLLVNGTPQPQEAGTNLIAGPGITITNADNPGNETSDITIAANGSGGAGPVWVQDCTAGGTIVYSGPGATLGSGSLPNLIILAGTPGSEYIFSLPYLAFDVTILCLTSTASADVYYNGSPAVLLGNNQQIGFTGTGTAYYFITPVTGDVAAHYAGAYSGYWNLIEIAGVNQRSSGTAQSIPIYGAALNLLDATTYGVGIPSVGTGPGVVPSGVSLLENESFFVPDTLGGLVGMNSSGASETVIPWAFFVNNPWNTQALDKGKFVIGDTLTGPSQSQTFPFVVVNPSAVGNSAIMRVTATAKVVTAGGGAESANDTYSKVFLVTISTASSVSRIVGTATTLHTASDTSMVGTSITLGISSGFPAITYATNGTIDAGTTVDFQIRVEPDTN